MKNDINLKDYFAAKAMNALLNGKANNNIQFTNHEIAKEAYGMAEAMINEKKKRENVNPEKVILKEADRQINM